MLLEGKRVLVTGASRGIGQAIALACAMEGATVGINFVTSNELAEQLADKIRDELDGHAHVLEGDVGDVEQASQIVARFVEAAGGLDALVNNAGVVAPGLLVNQPDGDIQRVVQTNLFGPIFCARASLPIFLRQKSGVIINIGSVSASKPFRGQCVYAATKGGVEALTKALAVEYGRKGIRVCCVRPGPIETDMLEGAIAMANKEITQRVPLRRFGAPNEVGALVAFLASDQASFVSGTTVDVDGGFALG